MHASFIDPIVKSVVRLAKTVMARLVAVALLVGGGLPAPGAVIVYEGFDYATGASLTGQNGGSNWTSAWVANGNTATGATNVANSLSYTDSFGKVLVTSGGSAFLSGFSSANTTAQPYRDLPVTRGTDGTTTYVSFLGLRAGPVTNTVPPYYQRVAGVQLREAGTERATIGRATATSENAGLLPKDTWGIYFGGNGTNTQPTSVSLSNLPATLLVLRIDHLAGNDNVFLYVNPPLGTEPATTSAQVSTNGNTTFSRLELFTGNSSAAGIFAQMQFDELRVADTYAEVTPFVSAGTAPGISVDLSNKVAQLCANTTFNVGATGSAPLTFHWFFNTALTNSGTSAALTVSNVSVASAGNYFVIVSNSLGTATSTVVSLTVTDTTPPVISQCASNVTVYASPACQGVIPNLTGAVVATDCSGITSITQNPINGAIVGTGPQVVTLTVIDGSNNVATCNATVTVVSTNAPVILSCAPNQFLNANVSQQAAIPDLTGLVTATNQCGSVTVTQSPLAGTLVGPGTNTVTLTAASGTNTASCNTLVIVNARPVAANQSVTNALDTSFVIALGGSDAEGGPLTFYIVAAPTNGTLGTLSSNLVTYEPDEGYTGTDAFTFSVSDGAVTSAVALVSITITNLPFPTAPQIVSDGTTIFLQDYASIPISNRGGSLSNATPPLVLADYSNQLARINFLRAEPTNAPLSSVRFFVPDLNRNLYILTRSNKALTTYINLQAVFPKFDNDPGYAGGLVCVQFDPDYANNGKFYTVHTEDPAIAGTVNPTNIFLPALNLTGYTTTTVLDPPAGTVLRQGVLVEWTDTNIANDTFEGTAREIMRVGFNGNLHPMGDLAFNPLAAPGDADYRNLYISNGDGGAGEANDSRHTIPQRLDAVQGKILRITPDVSLRPADLLVTNGAVSLYRIPTTGPDPNPFVSLGLSGLKKEIYAYGFRNPHRMSWDAASNQLLVDDIGLHAWEEVNIVHKGTNYGYAEREGTEQLFVNTSPQKTGSQLVPVVPFPATDTLIVTGLVAAVTPTYPVANYSHADGDAISSGFVYRGSLMPQLRGKYIFGDITTGRLFYADLAEMMAKDDGIRTTVAAIHELQIAYNHPSDSPDLGLTKWRMWDIVAVTYTNRGGKPGAQRLPGTANATAAATYGKGRSDIRLAMDPDGELYVLSKSDGVIRQMTALVLPVVQNLSVTNDVATVTWSAINGLKYRLQFKTNLADATWNNVAPDVTAGGPTASQTNASSAAGQRFYRVTLVP